MNWKDKYQLDLSEALTEKQFQLWVKIRTIKGKILQQRALLAKSHNPDVQLAEIFRLEQELSQCQQKSNL